MLLGLIISTITQLNFLFEFFPIQQQPWDSNMMSTKGLNLLDECAAKYVHLLRAQLGIFWKVAESLQIFWPPWLSDEENFG